MRSSLLISRIFRLILKFKNNKESIGKIKNFDISSKKRINLDLTIIISTIAISMIYYIITNKIINSLLLFLILNNLYLIYFVLNVVEKIKKIIEIKFEYEKSLEREEKIKNITKKNMIKRLIVLDEYGNDKIVYEIIKDEYVIGKSTLKNIVDIDLSSYKNEELVSRRQARVYRKNKNYYLIDEGSKNGTNIIKTNNRKINLQSFKEEKLMIGDIIEISKIKILVN